MGPTSDIHNFAGDFVPNCVKEFRLPGLVRSSEWGRLSAWLSNCFPGSHSRFAFVAASRHRKDNAVSAVQHVKNVLPRAFASAQKRRKHITVTNAVL